MKRRFTRANSSALDTHAVSGDIGSCAKGHFVHIYGNEYGSNRTNWGSGVRDKFLDCQTPDHR